MLKWWDKIKEILEIWLVRKENQPPCGKVKSNTISQVLLRSQSGQEISPEPWFYFPLSILKSLFTARINKHWRMRGHPARCTISILYAVIVIFSVSLARRGNEQHQSSLSEFHGQTAEQEKMRGSTTWGSSAVNDIETVFILTVMKTRQGRYRSSGYMWWLIDQMLWSLVYCRKMDLMKTCACQEVLQLTNRL